MTNRVLLYKLIFLYAMVSKILTYNTNKKLAVKAYSKNALNLLTLSSTLNIQ